jgi:hypothetical protein
VPAELTAGAADDTTLATGVVTALEDVVALPPNKARKLAAPSELVTAVGDEAFCD